MKTITTSYDPWEAYLEIEEFNELRLTNIEFTTTTLCNMRCEHCAVGYTLQTKDPDPLPLDLLIQRLEEIPHLRSLSITGGEPMLSNKSVDNYVVPLLKYAHERGVRTQINSNLTLELSRYEKIISYLDVLHISHNYSSVDDFVETGFAMMEKKPSYEQRAQYFTRMIENTKALSKEGVLVSAETMINKRTLPHLESIHNQIIEMGCKRHEIHPMYPSDFASTLEVATTEELKNGIRRLLAYRNKDVWMLFGTLPFYACSSNKDDLALLEQLYNAENVTVRNDPDGRTRLNINIFNGDIIVTDFGDIPSLGNITNTSLQNAYEGWIKTDFAKSISCHCKEVQCLGPNPLVKDTYYKDIDFTKQKSKIVLR
ncbi:radical SAM/CxCxxxxC motif protein YfkAB [Anaerobacillus alkalidiazotrophicus]|uniref:Radical SAM/CxCxxxxC motif protein YfkAB n=1 Tax=Anaerobacillus alkalidiazotrophicus TaxID=472963 RepID=A0A1S2MCH1_9BACI|nr:radical SAM/CxCxxxxC motif protein YfkAB [Anaerobacillus alkalidiazotrophicus]OIJ22438.1 radical SAM/CxCxxxxC motif protein YfkAB [Anaerobacillus alkalidiazotrophicus]